MDKNIIAQIDTIIGSATILAPCGADVILGSAFKVAQDLIADGHMEEATYLINNFPVEKVIAISAVGNPIESLRAIPAVIDMLEG